VLWICRSGNMEVNLCNPHSSTQLLVVLHQERSGQVQVEQREEPLLKRYRGSSKLRSSALHGGLTKSCKSMINGA